MLDFPTPLSPTTASFIKGANVSCSTRGIVVQTMTPCVLVVLGLVSLAGVLALTLSDVISLYTALGKEFKLTTSTTHAHAQVAARRRKSVP